MESTGYSGTPLAKKLGLKEGFKLLLYNYPVHYFELFSDLPKNLQIVKEALFESIDFIHLFCLTQEELEEILPTYQNALKKDGLLWVSWPKGSSSIATDLKREIIRECVLETGLVDVKVAAIDKDWSGLKFVFRLKDR